MKKICLTALLIFLFADFAGATVLYTGTTVSSGVARWKMDDSSAPATDSWGSVNLSVSGSATFNKSGQFGTSVQLGGSPNYLYASNPSSMNFSASDGSMTFTAWVKTSVATDGIIAGRTENIGGDCWKFYFSASGYLGFLFGEPTAGKYLQLDATETDIRDGAWHHVAVSYETSLPSSPDVNPKDLDSTALYVDGVAVATTATADDATWNGTIGDDFDIGADRSSWNAKSYFSGYVDDACYWLSALSADDIYQVYLGNLE